MLLKLLLLLLVLLQTSTVRVTSQQNNACKSFQDYLHYTTSENCYYNPDMLLETPELIMKYAGKFESYKITTEDGYILTRIPRKNPEGTILLQHPLTQNSRNYVGQGPDSLAFYLWGAGYDVWLNNQRGTLFSEGHTNLTVSDRKYWDFSFHEIGVYDTSSEVQLINKKTNKSKIIFIGLSESSTTGLIYSALRPQETKDSIKVFILMSTPCYFKYSSSPLIHISRLEPVIKGFVDFFQLGAVLIYLPTIRRIGGIMSRLFPVIALVVAQLFSLFCGWTPNETDPMVLNLDAMIYIKQFSWKIVLHYLQLAHTKTRFQMYDYGKEGNLKMYNSEVPLPYPIENISVPVLMMTGENDTLTSPENADLLFQELPEEAKIYGQIKIPGFNHADFILGKHKKERAYEKILNFINDVSIMKN